MDTSGGIGVHLVSINGRAARRMISPKLGACSVTKYNGMEDVRCLQDTDKSSDVAERR